MCVCVYFKLCNHKNWMHFTVFPLQLLLVFFESALHSFSYTQRRFLMRTHAHIKKQSLRPTLLSVLWEGSNSVRKADLAILNTQSDLISLFLWRNEVRQCSFVQNSLAAGFFWFLLSLRHWSLNVSHPVLPAVACSIVKSDTGSIVHTGLHGVHTLQSYEETNTSDQDWLS